MSLLLFLAAAFLMVVGNSALAVLAFVTSLIILAKAASLKRRRMHSVDLGSSPKLPRNQYGIASTTLNGESVKSIGEKTIADYLYGKHIEYTYESPAYDMNGNFISKPDFYLPYYDAHIEYWGMLEVKDPRKRADYVEKMNWKLDRFARNGIKLISLYPEDLHDLDNSLYGRLMLLSK